MADICSQCGKEIVCEENSFGTGYGVDKADNKICYACCGVNDEKELVETGKLVGYFSLNGDDQAHRRAYRKARAQFMGCQGTFGNWPGSLKIDVYSIKHSTNNFGAQRFDFWFVYKSVPYWGVNIGDSQIARVKKIKKL